MTKKLKYSNYTFQKKRSKFTKPIFRNTEQYAKYFERKEKILFTKFIRRKLKKRITNRKMLKYPVLRKYFS
jgi:hypothetical protein